MKANSSKLEFSTEGNETRKPFRAVKLSLQRAIKINSNVALNIEFLSLNLFY